MTSDPPTTCARDSRLVPAFLILLIVAVVAGLQRLIGFQTTCCPIHAAEAGALASALARGYGSWLIAYGIVSGVGVLTCAIGPRPLIHFLVNGIVIGTGLLGLALLLSLVVRL